MYLDKNTLARSERIRRLNIVNSISGVKSVNLIGTISEVGQTNLAVFSSVVHLGSDPALLGFISRPIGQVRRHTLENIMKTSCYTINHVSEMMAERAHYTSAKFEEDQSEFDHCCFGEQYLKDFSAPFVSESQLKIGMKLLEIQEIKANKTLLVIGAVEHVIIDDDALSEEGYVDFGVLKGVGLSGLNNYYRLNHLASFPYARVSVLPDFGE